MSSYAPTASPTADVVAAEAHRSDVQRTLLREVLMGAQDNLTNVLAVVLGVAIGAGRADMVALAGLAAGIAEAISMGGVLYTATRAEQDLDGVPAVRAPGARRRLAPLQAGAVTFGAGMIAGLVPLVPFLVLPLLPAMAVCLGISIVALFGLGTWSASVTGRSRVRDGLRLVLIAGTAAVAAAAVGAWLRVD